MHAMLHTISHCLCQGNTPLPCFTAPESPSRWTLARAGNIPAMGRCSVSAGPCPAPPSPPHPSPSFPKITHTVDSFGRMPIPKLCIAQAVLQSAQDSQEKPVPTAHATDVMLIGPCPVADSAKQQLNTVTLIHRRHSASSDMSRHKDRAMILNNSPSLCFQHLTHDSPPAGTRGAPAGQEWFSAHSLMMLRGRYRTVMRSIVTPYSVPFP